MSQLINPFVATIYDAYRDFGIVGDHRVVFDGATTGGTGIITSPAAAQFTVEDIGRRITLTGAGVGGAVYVGVVSSINSATSVNVTPNTTTTVSARGLQLGTDNTAAINNFVTFVNTTSAANPGIVLEFGQSPTNGWGWPVRSVFNKTVEFRGLSGSFNVDAGDYSKTGGTRLAWWSDTEDGGTEFGAWLTFEPAGGDTQPIVEPAFRHIWFDARNGDQAQALIAIKFAGCVMPILEDIFIIDSKVGVLMESGTVVLNPVSAQGVLRPNFTKVNGRLLETFVGAILTPITTSSAITLTNTGQNITVSAATMPTTVNSRYAWVATHIGNPVMVLYTGGGTTTLNVKVSPADAIYAYATVSGGNVVSCAPNNGPMYSMSGNTTSNTNCGVIMHGQISSGANWGPATLDFRNCDSMSMYDIYVNGGSNVNDGAINRVRKPGYRMAGHNTDVGLACRNNTVRGGDTGSAGGGGLSTMGVLNTGAKMGFPSGPTYYDLLQLANGAPIPTQEPFSHLDWAPNGGMRIGGKNASVTSQAPAAATLTQLNGSQLIVPPQGFQVGTKIRWVLDISKTAAGAAARNWFIRIGANGTTADAIICTFTTPVGTAAIDTAKVEFEFTIRTIGAAATSVGSYMMIRNNITATGFLATANQNVNYIQVNGTAFSTVTSGLLYCALSLTTGAAEVITIQQCSVEVINPANP